MKLRNIIALTALAAVVSLFAFSDAQAAKYRIQQRVRVPGGTVKTTTRVQAPARVLRRTSVSTNVAVQRPVVYRPVYYSSYGCY